MPLLATTAKHAKANRTTIMLKHTVLLTALTKHLNDI